VVVLTNFGGGSPIMVELAEELVAMGARRMVTMTWGGILQSEIKAGDIVVCNSAIRDDGTSHHYLPHAKYVEADAGLVQQLVDAIRASGAQCTVGSTWTVEMESAGLFTVGQVRRIQTASVVIGMDSLADYHWRVPDRLDDIMHSLETVYAACIDVLGSR
jgi:uridine phosphorylase